MRYLLLIPLFFVACGSGGSGDDETADTRTCFISQDASGQVYDQAEGSGFDIVTENNITFICGDSTTVNTTVQAQEPEELAEFLSTAKVK